MGPQGCRWPSPTAQPHKTHQNTGRMGLRRTCSPPTEPTVFGPSQFPRCGPSRAYVTIWGEGQAYHKPARFPRGQSRQPHRGPVWSDGRGRGHGPAGQRRGRRLEVQHGREGPPGGGARPPQQRGRDTVDEWSGGGGTDDLKILFWKIFRILSKKEKWQNFGEKTGQPREKILSGIAGAVYPPKSQKKKHVLTF